MDNKTIIVPSSEEDFDTLTGFETKENQSFDNFKNETMNFVRNSTKKYKGEIDKDKNPYISASSSMFKELILVQKNPKIDEIGELRQLFMDNINEYMRTISFYNVDESSGVLSRYVLCTVIDEFVNNIFNKQDNDWSSNSLLNIFHNESYGGENFFKLLDKFLRAPAKHIHLLELMYISLSMGFQGKYRIGNNKKRDLDLIKDSLFKQIKMIRGKESNKFYVQHKSSKIKHRLFYMVQYSTIFLSTIILLSIVYGGLSYALYDRSNIVSNMIKEKYGNNIAINIDKYRKAISE